MLVGMRNDLRAGFVGAPECSNLLVGMRNNSQCGDCSLAPRSVLICSLVCGHLDDASATHGSMPKTGFWVSFICLGGGAHRMDQV